MWPALVTGALAVSLIAQTPKATPRGGPLTVSIALRPSIGEPGAAPRLIVSVRNPTKAAIPFMRFTSGACFAHFSLAGSLTTPDGSKPLDATCPIREWPGQKATLEPGATEERTLELKELFPSEKWAAGSYALDLEWDPSNLGGYFGGAYAVGASSTSHSGSGFTLAPVLATLRLERGQEAALPDGSRITFTSHGHRGVPAGREPSLIINGVFAAPNAKAPSPFSVSTHPDASNLLLIDGRTFVVGELEYDRWMTVRYFGKLAGR